MVFTIMFPRVHGHEEKERGRVEGMQAWCHGIEKGGTY
jgi:hypothetical protein